MTDQFDDDFDDEQEEKKKRSAEFAKMLEDSFKKSNRRLNIGDKIKGEVLVIGKDEVFVSTGTMHDGLVPRRDLLDQDGKISCKVGDSLDLFVTHVKGSEIYLSPKPTSQNLADDLEDAFDMMLPVEGRVTELCKGGFRVSVMGKSAFCPLSQMDVKRIETPEEYVGQKYQFRITQFTERGRNIVVSRRKQLEEERELSQGSFLEQVRPGEVRPGKVTRLEKFGAFIDLGDGVEGLAHISELSWSRVNEPHEVLQVGQEIKVKVLKVELEEGRLRVSLSLKQAEQQPWDHFPSTIQSGAIVEGKVVRCAKFGAFVELAPGIEGLIPLSEMSYSKRVLRSDEFVKEGQKALVKVKEIHPDTRKILLSLKDNGLDPRAPQEVDQEDWKSHAPAQATSLGTLGDQFKNLNFFDKDKDKKKKKVE